MLGHELAAHVEHGFRGGNGEPRRDSVAKAAPSMVPLDEEPAFAVRTIRRHVELWTEQAIGYHKARDDAQT